MNLYEITRCADLTEEAMREALAYLATVRMHRLPRDAAPRGWYLKCTGDVFAEDLKPWRKSIDSALEALARPEYAHFSGIMFELSWTQLQPRRGVYDFSVPREIFDRLAGLFRSGIVELRYKSFRPTRGVWPDFILPMVWGFTDTTTIQGWTAPVHIEAVGAEFCRLLSTYRGQFDGYPGCGMIQTSESALGDVLTESGDADAQYDTLRAIIAELGRFEKTIPCANINWFPKSTDFTGEKIDRVLELMQWAQDFGVGAVSVDTKPTPATSHRDTRLAHNAILSSWSMKNLGIEKAYDWAMLANGTHLPVYGWDDPVVLEFTKSHPGTWQY